MRRQGQGRLPCCCQVLTLPLRDDGMMQHRLRLRLLVLQLSQGLLGWGCLRQPRAAATALLQSGAPASYIHTQGELFLVQPRSRVVRVGSARKPADPPRASTCQHAPVNPTAALTASFHLSKSSTCCAHSAHHLSACNCNNNSHLARAPAVQHPQPAPYPSPPAHKH